MITIALLCALLVHHWLARGDYTCRIGINERHIRELATMSCVANGENVLLLGPPGVGNMHLAIALGMAAIQQATSAYVTTSSTCWSNCTEMPKRIGWTTGSTHSNDRSCSFWTKWATFSWIGWPRNSCSS